MALSEKNYGVNNGKNGFRVNVIMKNTGFFKDTQTKFFFMGKGAFDESLIDEICQEVIDNKPDWKQGKKSQTFPLKTINSTAIITKHEIID
jgi:hypothetical protein